MRLLLDTATLILAVQSPERLSKRAATTLKNSEHILELSTVSLTEIAIKASVGKLQFSSDDVQQAIADLDLRLLPYTAEHAFRLFALPLHHRDPFDRQIIAQALVEGVGVITPDEAFQRYSGLTIVW